MIDTNDRWHLHYHYVSDLYHIIYYIKFNPLFGYFNIFTCKLKNGEENNSVHLFLAKFYFLSNQYFYLDSDISAKDTSTKRVNIK